MEILRGVGDLKSQTFKRKVWGLTGISRGVGGFKPKIFWGRGMDIAMLPVAGHWVMVIATERHQSCPLLFPGQCTRSTLFLA